MNLRRNAASPLCLLVLTASLLLAGCTQAPPTTITADARVGAPALTAPARAPATSSAPATSNFINVHALIIVRHGDIDVAKKRIMGDRVPLTDRGNERAKELAYALKDAGITRIVTSEALRTQQTAAVLIEQLHITPEIPFQHGPYMKGDASKTENSTVVGYLAERGKPTDTVLLVYHHSVIPSIMKELGFPAEPRYTDATEFDRIYVLLPDPATKTYQLFRLRYGGDWHQK